MTCLVALVVIGNRYERELLLTPESEGVIFHPYTKVVPEYVPDVAQAVTVL